MNGKFVVEIPQGAAVCLVEDGRLSVFRFCLLAVPLKQGIWTRFQQVGAIGENQNVVKLARCWPGSGDAGRPTESAISASASNLPGVGVGALGLGAPSVLTESGQARSLTVYRTGPTMGLSVTASAGCLRAKMLSHSSPIRSPSPSEAPEGARVPTEPHLCHF